MLQANTPGSPAESLITEQIRTYATHFLAQVGVPVAVIGVLWIIAAHLGLIHKVALSFWRALSTFSKYARRKATQGMVADRINKYLSQAFFPRIAEATRPDVNIEFVETAEEVRQHADGRVIVRMRQDRDPELNMLLALSTAVGQIFFPNVRPWLNKTTRAAIDLQIVSDLATTMSDRAWSLFNTHILQPRLGEDSKLEDRIQQVQAIADAGFFESVLVQELIQLSDRLVRKVPSGLGLELDEFVTWLYELAIRPPGDERSDLSFHRTHVKSSALLAAKQSTAMHGTEPYRRRARRNLFAGGRHIYLLGLTGEHKAFVDEIAAEILKDKLATILKRTDIRKREPGSDRTLRLVMFRRDELRFSGKTYSDFARDEGVEVGKRLDGAITEINDDFISVQLGEIEARLARAELGWGYRGKPQWIVVQGAPITVVVTEIVDDQCVVKISAKRLRPSPWLAGWAPKRDEVCKGEVIGVTDAEFVAVRVRAPKGFEGEIYGVVPPRDWSWYAKGSSNYVAPRAGDIHSFRVTSSNPAIEEITLGRATLETRDWGTVSKLYPKGKRCRAKVIHVDYDGVRCELEQGVFGRIDRPQLIKAGFEYADFTATVVPGQAIDVEVIGRREKRRFLKLDLQRNMAALPRLPHS